jgi:glycosyltransferase involved in cell wall biosynthesis
MRTIATLTIIIPVYNEERTILAVLGQVMSAKLHYPLNREIIVVNDASGDKTATLVEGYINEHPQANIRLVHHAVNQGKGGCIHTGIREASGDLVLVQDADLEYDPRDYHRLLQPVMEDRADVVYSSRFMGAQPHRILFFWHSIGNKFLTFLSNMFTNLNLTDMESGYKLFRREIIQSMPLQEKRFGFEPEVTAKVARIPGIRIYEVGISYYGRSYLEGKKINWKDGVRAIFAILKYNVFARYKHKGGNTSFPRIKR